MPGTYTGNRMNMARNVPKIRKVKVLVIGLIMLLGLLAIRLYDSNIHGAEYRDKISKCGTKDLIVIDIVPTTEQKVYTKPGDPHYGAPAVGVHYVCTEQEAIDAGYTHYP